MAARELHPCLRCGSDFGFIYQGLLLCTPCRNVMTREERLEWTA